MQLTPTFTSGYTSGAGTSVFARIAAYFGLSERIAANAKRRQIMRELESMDNRELADLGIDRADFHRIARGEQFAR